MLLSGGIDSTAATALLKPEGALVIDYGQVCAEAERRAAAAVAAHLLVPLLVVRTNLLPLGSGDLANSKPSELSPSPEWWPFRNQFLATIGAAVALRDRFDTVMLASVVSDGFHSDGTPPFYERLNELCALQEGHIGVEAPVISDTSVELVLRAGVGIELLGWTHSCHVGNLACGQCRGCTKRREVLDAVGMWP